MTKLCKDCKYYRKDWISHLISQTDRYDTCTSPNTTKNVITGRSDNFCEILRDGCYEILDHSCGPSGKFWESK